MDKRGEDLSLGRKEPLESAAFPVSIGLLFPRSVLT